MSLASSLLAAPEAPPAENKQAYPFALPPLPYEPGALEPTIDEATMKLHHDKDHQAYLDKLNAALKDQPDLQKMSIQELLGGLDKLPEAIRSTVRNQGGGYANHNLFWTLMAPKGKMGAGGEPAGNLEKAISRDFESVAGFKKAFEEAGAKHFGSGWVWLLSDPKSKKLVVKTTPNQDHPILEGAVPILGNDVWEHAYYLKHKNKRADYLKEWWDVVAWETVAKRFDGIVDGSVSF